MIAAVRQRLRAALRSAAEFRRFQATRPEAVRVGQAVRHGYVDRIAVHADGVLAVEGWAADLVAFRDDFTLSLAGDERHASHAYRIERSDVRTPAASGSPFSGAVVEWVLDGHPRPRTAVLACSGRALVSFEVPRLVEPAYAHLRDETRVLARDNIYGFGPPVPHVSSEVLALARTLPQPILDFGCGAGAMVAALRREGIEVFGLELDNARIREHLMAEAKPWVTLYDGALPAPFDAGQFKSVSCCEVLEHIPDSAPFVAELARLAGERLCITVPDMSAIPRGFHHGVVPWHLLESTHVNFFTQRSLETLLAPLASRVEIARIGVVNCDRMRYFTSLAALVDR